MRNKRKDEKTLREQWKESPAYRKELKGVEEIAQKCNPKPVRLKNTTIVHTEE